MNAWRVSGAMILADFRERTRRTSFLVTICLVIYLGYAVNTGQILIKLGAYRGVYNSAWVGSLMTLVITFFLGIAGFFLVKNAIERDERTGVGQIIAATPITRVQYLTGKWLSNFAVLAALVALLAVAAVLMQWISHEDTQIQLWALLAPFLLVALPMLALVAALAVLFETIPWLKGGFGNLVYFFVFIGLFMAGIFLTDLPWLDVTGISLIGESMKTALKNVDPAYGGQFVLSMASDQAMQTFVYPGVVWTATIILQRLGWLLVSFGTVLFGTIFFNRFNSNDSAKASLAFPFAWWGQRRPHAAQENVVEHLASAAGKIAVPKQARLSPLEKKANQGNFSQLVWLEILLLLKGVKWFWYLGMAALWAGGVLAGDANTRNLFYMLACIWPVLIWAQMGEREVHFQTEQLVFQTPSPLLRLTLSSWLAGVLLTALAASGVLVGQALAGEPAAGVTWLLSVVFIPTLALVLGAWSRSSKLFQVVYPILWYLGPFNKDGGLAVLDFLGLHGPSPFNTAPLLVAGFLLALILLALAGRRRQMRLYS